MFPTNESYYLTEVEASNYGYFKLYLCFKDQAYSHYQNNKLAALIAQSKSTGCALLISISISTNSFIY